MRSAESCIMCFYSIITVFSHLYQKGIIPIMMEWGSVNTSPLLRHIHLYSKCNKCQNRTMQTALNIYHHQDHHHQPGATCASLHLCACLTPAHTAPKDERKGGVSCFHPSLFTYKECGVHSPCSVLLPCKREQFIPTQGFGPRRLWSNDRWAHNMHTKFTIFTAVQMLGFTNHTRIS